MAAKKGRDGIVAAIERAPPALSVALEMPFGFSQNEKGVWFDQLLICGPLEIVAESRPEGSDHWGLLLKWRDRDGKVHEWIMPRRLLAGEAMEVRSRLMSCGLYVASGDRPRREFIRFLSEVKIPARVRTVATTGWYRPPDGGAAFILPGRTIGVVPGEVVRLDMDPPPAIYQAKGSLEGWRSEVAARCVGNSRLIFGVCCAFTAPLLALAEDEGGGINIRGGSSRGKTTVLDVAASAWGRPSKSGPNSFTNSWRHTEYGLEGTSAAHNHVLLTLDELGEADPLKLGGVIYMLSGGVGKTRGQRGGGGNAQTVTWLTLLLSSGEQTAARLMEQARQQHKAGQEIRLLDVPGEVEGGHGCFEALHGAADGSAFAVMTRKAMLAEHGTAGPAFIVYLVDRLAREADFVAEALAEPVAAWCARHVPAGSDGQVRRAARRLGLVATAGELASAAGITGWPPGAAAAGVGIIFRDWLTERGGIGGREDHHLRESFARFIGMHGAARFTPLRDPSEEDEGAQVEAPLKDGDRTINRAGWRWQEVNEVGERRWVLGIIPQVFDAEVASPLGLEGRDARARLGKAGLIRGEQTTDGMRWTIKVKRIPGGGRPRLMVVQPSALDGA